MIKKDKLITIRVSEETRDKFNQWCEDNQVKGSSFLSDIINGCIDGSISPNMASQSIDNTASQKISEMEETVNSLSSQLNTLEDDLYYKLSKSIDNIVNQKVVELEDKVSSLSSQLESLYYCIDKSIEVPRIVETETVELEEVENTGTITPEKKKKVVKGDSRRAKSKKEADTVDSADKPTHDSSTDDNAELVLSLRKLAGRLGYKHHKTLSTKFKSLSKEDFIDWTKSKDPEGKGWYKTEKGFKVVL